MPVAESRLEILQVCKLLQCVRKKDAVQIEKLVTSGVPQLINYNEPDEGNTALSVAAQANDEDTIDLLLELGAHPDVVDLKGRSPIMHAAMQGHVQCVEKLANAGANMKLKDLEGKGVLFYCINSSLKHIKCMEVSLSFGAEVNDTSKTGLPIFNFACCTASENEDMCLMLLQKGADCNSVDEKTGRTALMAACGSGSLAVVKAILATGAEVNKVDKRKNHAAHDAAKGGHFQCLVALAGYGADFDQFDRSGNSPIHLGARVSAGPCCKYLGQRGCNAKAKNADGQTAKAIGKEIGKKSLSKDLAGAERFYNRLSKPDAKTPSWKIHLYDWVYTRSSEITETCKKYDTEGAGLVPKEDFLDVLRSLAAPIPNEDSAEFRSVMSVIEKEKGLIELKDFTSGKKLVEKAYLISAFEGKKKKKKKGGKKKKGKTKIALPICTLGGLERESHGAPPVMWVPRYQHFTDAGRFDREHPAEHPLQDDSVWYLTPPEKSYVSITEAAKYGDFETLKNCLERGVSIDTRDKYYKTPLMMAAQVGNLPMVQYLVEAGASLAAEDNFKWTALHHACHTGQLQIVAYLVNSGAEINSSTLSGGTPLNRAIESSRVEVVQYLIEKGIRMQTENKKGLPPMKVSYAWADPRVIESMEEKLKTLPPPSDKKKGKGGGKKPARPASVPSGGGSRPES